MSYCKTCARYDAMGYGYACPCTHHGEPMEPAVKSQVMDREERLLNSLESALPFDPKDPSAKDMTRQEHALEADINYLVDRYTPGAPMRQITYGEADFTMDLQQAFGAIALARHMHSRLPRELLEQYPTWQSLLNAVESGQFRSDLLNREQERQRAAGAALEDSETDSTSLGEREVERVSPARAAPERTSRAASRRSTHTETSEE